MRWATAKRKVRDLYDLGDTLPPGRLNRISACRPHLLRPGHPRQGQGAQPAHQLLVRPPGRRAPPTICWPTEPEDFPAALAPFADQLRGRAVLVKKASDPLRMCGPAASPGRQRLQGIQRKRHYLRHRRPPSGLERPAACPSRSSLRPPRPKPGTTKTSTTAISRTPWAPSWPAGRRPRPGALLPRPGPRRRPGLLLADTKLEFGQLDGELLLIDEVLTPDSSAATGTPTTGSRASSRSPSTRAIRN